MAGATVYDKLTAVGDAIREKRGGTELLSLDEMEVEIKLIETGYDISDATAIAADIHEGVTAYIADGKVEGTFTIRPELDEQNDLIGQIIDSLGIKAGADGDGSINLQVKYVTPSKAQQVIMPGSGYDALQSVTVYPIPDEYIITSDATATASDILSGKTAYVNGELIEGSLVVGEGGEDDLLFAALIDGSITEASNDTVQDIKDSAFSYCAELKTVDFPLATTVNSNAFRECSKLSVINLPRVNRIENYAFFRCSNLTNIYLPSVTYIGSNAFRNNTKLMEVNLPLVTEIIDYAFQDCTALITINFPLLEAAGYRTFQGCIALTKIDLPALARIGSFSFVGCSSLTTFILRSQTICTLSSTSAFDNTPIASGTGYFYVPSSLVDSYKAATNWSTYADQFRAIEDYPEITGGDS